MYCSTQKVKPTINITNIDDSKDDDDLFEGELFSILSGCHYPGLHNSSILHIDSKGKKYELPRPPQTKKEEKKIKQKSRQY